MRFLVWNYLLILPLLNAANAAGGAEAEIRGEGSRWVLRTSRMERVIRWQDGQLRLERFIDRTTGRSLLADGAVVEEFLPPTEEPGAGTNRTPSDWRFVGTRQSKLALGERQLEITLQQANLQVTKSYLIYPGSSIVREWLTLKNTGSQSIRIQDPCFLHLRTQLGLSQPPDFSWMSGGENQPGSWKLKTEALSTARVRQFDSYDPFPSELVDAKAFPGDGIDAKILLNDRPIWPATNWQYVANATARVPFEFQAEVQAGDRLVFLVNMHGNIGYDTTALDPTITYADGETHTASKEFSEHQGEHGWRYQYLENGKYVDLVYYPTPKQWRKEKDNATGTPFVGVGDQHPDSGQDAARVWTAPKAGTIRVTGSICNTGNGGASNPVYGFRPGSASYAPWYALYAPNTRQGIFIGWDYFGHWRSSFRQHADGSVTAQLNVAGHRQMLAPGESVTTPKAFTGLFHDDLDHAGNECLDWQYQYLWDYTRDGWFPAIRMLGYWMNGTPWGQPGAAWTGGQPDYDSTFRKVFRVADLMRSVGADVYHRDWGWWDRAGDWNGPDFRATIQYLRQYGMGQLIYAFIYTVDKQSKVAREHPDWVLGETLDLSRPEVVAFLQKQLDQFVDRWGNFEWRNDSFFTAPRQGDDRGLLGQDEGLRRVIRNFLDRHPKCAFQAVNGGGNYGGYDYTRYASSFSFSDGAVGPLRNYYAALLFPPDKTSDIPDIWNPNDYNPATWRGLLCLNFDMTGDTIDAAKLEGVRELIDIYHYLHQQGVVGRWVHVFRPRIQGDDPTLYFERLSRDGLRGIIIPKHPAPAPVTIWPNGLRSEQRYQVSFQESARRESRTGADLMSQGIRIEQMPPGELIYLNLPFHPGNHEDQRPPSPPSAVTQHVAESMGYPGVALHWKAGRDDQWVSSYEVFRDGTTLGKAAKGTFFFDHSAGADPAASYEVLTLDSAGNRSARRTAHGRRGLRAVVADDALGSGIDYRGEWQHEDHLLPAHQQTLSTSGQPGAEASWSFTGRSVLIFGRQAADGGRVEIRVDDQAPETVDTYSADDIWGACLYRHRFPTAGRHIVRITVTGRQQARAKDHRVHLDGIRAEPD